MARKKKGATDEGVAEIESLRRLVQPIDKPLPEGVPACPGWAKGSVRDAYYTFAHVLADSGDATATDYAALAKWCKWYDVYVEAQLDLDANGYVQRTQTGYEQIRPQVSVAQSAISIMLQIGKEIGLYRRSRKAIEGASQSDSADVAEYDKRYGKG